MDLPIQMSGQWIHHWPFFHGHQHATQLAPYFGAVQVTFRLHQITLSLLQGGLAGRQCGAGSGP